MIRRCVTGPGGERRRDVGAMPVRRYAVLAAVAALVLGTTADAQRRLYPRTAWPAGRVDRGGPRSTRPVIAAPPRVRPATGARSLPLRTSADAGQRLAPRRNGLAVTRAAGERLGGGVSYASPEAVTLDRRDLFERDPRDLLERRTRALSDPGRR